MSKSIVVYHQMKSNMQTSNGPFSESRYKNAMMLSTEDKNFDEHYYKDDAIDYLKALQESSEGIKKHAVQPNGVSDATAATSGNYIDFRSRKVAAKKLAPI
jgi:hypothetical protein